MEVAMIESRGTEVKTTERRIMSGPADSWPQPPVGKAPIKSTSSNSLEEATLLDLDGALRRMGGDRNLLSCLAKVFAEDSPGLLDRLTSAVATMQGEQIRAAAHALRGLVANFGSQSLMQPLRQLEELGARDDLMHARSLLQEVCDKTNRLQDSLQELD
jgi:HPt (histidine-containing phosphotransfer) domain-containing protein